MTKDKERDDAMIAEMAEMLRKSRAFIFVHHNKSPLLLEIDALLRGDEPAKLDRYVVAWQEADSAFGHCDCDRSENCPHAAAVLRRHFEPPSEVVEAAEMVQRLSEGATAGTYYASAKAIADFILKGDQ